VLADAALGRDLVLAGTMMASLPARGRPEAGLQLADSVMTGRLGERPGPDGSELVVTVIDPPVFGPDRLALAGTTPGSLLRDGRRGWRVPAGSMP
jgi:hypothetical protein